jgi:RNA polymerase sigma-70 factor, ECF subfamily
MQTSLGSRIAHWDSVAGASLEEGFARGDAIAYEAAYRSFGSRMLATAMRLLRDREAAYECVQDVFLHLWGRRSAYTASRGSLEAFLVTCARNRALAQLRAGKRREAAVGKLEPNVEDAFHEDPLERERIKRALAQLTQDQADVVRLAYFCGMTLAEVASHLTIPIGTVKTRLSAGLRALRRSLAVVTGNGI